MSSKYFDYIIEEQEKGAVAKVDK